jgi:hypothetical protein
MNTHIKTIHNEAYSDGSKELGILQNYSDDDSFKESLIYIYNNERAMYTFFNTIVSMIDHMFYPNAKITRAYMSEEDFDKYYDTEYIEGKFSDLLTWTK